VSSAGIAQHSIWGSVTACPGETGMGEEVKRASSRVCGCASAGDGRSSNVALAKQLARGLCAPGSFVGTCGVVLPSCGSSQVWIAARRLAARAGGGRWAWGVWRGALR
jgi:hypothetical protein